MLTDDHHQPQSFSVSRIGQLEFRFIAVLFRETFLRFRAIGHLREPSGKVQFQVGKPR